MDWLFCSYLLLSTIELIFFSIFQRDKKVLWYAGRQDCSLKNMQYDVLPLLSAAKREKFWRYVKFWVIVSEERNEI